MVNGSSAHQAKAKCFAGRPRATDPPWPALLDRDQFARILFAQDSSGTDVRCLVVTLNERAIEGADMWMHAEVET